MYIDINRNFSDIINNNIKLLDLVDMVEYYQQYIGYLSFNTDLDINVDIREDLEKII